MPQSLSTPRVYLGNQPLPGLWGDLVIRHRWPYGCWEMTWGMVLRPYERPTGIIANAPIGGRLASGGIWAGNLAEPNWDTGEMTAVGAARQGETTLCLVGGETSSTPDAVIDAGIARGALGWTRLASISAVPFASGDNTADLNYATALLDADRTAAGQRWGVDARRRVYAAADPTVPSIYIRPGAGVLGVTEEQQAATVFGRYQTLSGALATVAVGAGAPEVGVYLGDHGRIDQARAIAVLTGIRDQLQAGTTWTNGLTVTADQVTTPGGERLGLDQVVAGKMARILGLRDVRGASAHTDIVIGESDWNVTAGTVEIKPVGLSDRSLPGIVEAAGGVLL